MEKRTRYNELLGIANHLRDPDLYQLLGWPDRLAFAPAELEERYRKNMSTLQGIKSPKHKSFIEFLKGELRRARATLADERQRQAYDAELLAERQEQLGRILDVVLADNTLDPLEEERLHALAAEVGLARTEAEALIDQELAARGAVRRSAEPAPTPAPTPTPPARPGSGTGSSVGSGTGSSVGSGTGSSVGPGAGSSEGGRAIDWLAPPAGTGSAAAWPGPVTGWAPPARAQGALDPAPTPAPPRTAPGRPASANDIQRAVARSLEPGAPARDARPGSGSRPGTPKPAPPKPRTSERPISPGAGPAPRTTPGEAGGRSTERRVRPPAEVVAEPVYDAEVVAEPVYDAEVVAEPVFDAEVVAEPVRPAPPRPAPSGKVTPVSTPRPQQPPAPQRPPAPADAPRKAGSSTARQAASAGWGKAAVVRAIGVCSSCLSEVDELSLQGGKAERIEDGRLHCASCRDRLVAGIICASCYQRITRTDLKGHRTRQVAGRIHHSHCAR